MLASGNISETISQDRSPCRCRARNEKLSRSSVPPPTSPWPLICRWAETRTTSGDSNLKLVMPGGYMKSNASTVATGPSCGRPIRTTDDVHGVADRCDHFGVT